MTGILLATTVGWAVLFSFSPLIAITVMAAPIGLFILVYYPYLLLSLIIFLISFQYYLVDYIPGMPASIVWVDDLLTFLLIIYTLAFKIPRSKSRNFTFLEWSLLGFLLVSVFSILANAVDPQIALEGVRGYIQPILLFYAARNLELPAKKVKWLFNFVILLIAGQLVFVIQNGLSTGQWWGDYVTGSFGSGQGTGFGHLLSIGIILVTINLLTNKPSLLTSIFLGSMLISLALASSRISYFLIPVILVWLLMRLPKKRFVTLLVLGGVIGMLALMVVNGYNFSDRDIDPTQNLSLSSIYGDQVTANRSGRFIWYEYSWNIFSHDWKTMLLGVGPGMFSSFTAERNITSYYSDILYVRQNGQIALLPTSVFITIPLEFGFLGSITLIGIFLFMVFRLDQQATSNTEQWYKTAAIGCKGSVAYLFFAGVTQNTWEIMYVAGYVWLLCGLILSINPENQLDDQKELASNVH